MVSRSQFDRYNTLLGWVAFLVALVVYLASVSPTASFWDCGEFIACANELEVPHPPGAPFYLLVGRFFVLIGSLLGLGIDKIAYLVNLVSVLSGAFTILFTFWIITYFAVRLLASYTNSEESRTLGNSLFRCVEKDSFTRAEVIAIFSSGFVGAFACMFADSFWFNTVEAEVYAMSSLFTALVFWLILKWERRADEPGHLKWLLLIAYLIGLSSGVHLLSLLTIPALTLIYYFRKFPFSWRGALVAFLTGAVILAFVQYGIMQITFDIAKWFEVKLVGYEDIQTGKTTGLGLPFGSGLFVWFLILFGGLIWGLYYSYTRSNITLNTVLWAILFIYFGFSSYSIILIRSAADPPIDENNPENVINFLSYMKREQYGDRPLLYGPLYNARPIDIEQYEDNLLKIEGKEKYVRDGKKLRYKYSAKDKRFFPRMYSPSHYTAGPFGYKNFVKNLGADPNSPYDDKPTGIENLKFFLEYQVYHMYIRYFLWNFVGRESDVQDSSWESGLEFSKLSKMPDWMKNDPTRNHYYFLPLLLGLLGAFWQFEKRRLDGIVILTLFFFTGLAIIIYLNQTPQQPRERDYSYAGSIQAFSIWIGLGVIFLYEFLQKFLKPEAGALIAGIISFLGVPILMGAENWDDHSRAGRYVAPDSANNLLESCAKNAVLFTNGDNDTFPLWYLQEVEGVRTDVRIINLSLLNTDWYIHQLKTQKSNEADPVPISSPLEMYMGERNSTIQWQEKTIKLPVNRDSVIKYQVVRPQDYDKILPEFIWTIKPRGGGYLLKQDWMIIDIVSTNAKQGWKRPIYFAITIPTESYVGLTNYFQLEGMAYRLVPLKIESKGRTAGYYGQVATDIMYENLMHKFKFRNLDNPNVFYDDNIERMVGNFRNNFFRLATALLEEASALQDTLRLKAQELSPEQRDSINKAILDKRTKAKEVMDYQLKVISDEAVPTEPYFLVLEAQVYLDLNERETARSLLEKAIYRATEYLDFVKEYRGEIDTNDLDFFALRYAIQILSSAGFDDLLSYTIGKMRTYVNDPSFQSALDALLKQIELRSGKQSPKDTLLKEDSSNQ